MEHCTVCWGVCGFASSRESLQMARSKEGFTSFCQAKDLLAASAQCRMCDYLFKRSKVGIKARSLSARVAINTRFHKFKRIDSSRNSADNLTIHTKVEGIDSDWSQDTDWSEEAGLMWWSVLAHRGSYPTRNHVLASINIVCGAQVIPRRQIYSGLQSITTTALAPSKRNYGSNGASSFTSIVPNPLSLYCQRES